jgi:hypothetical protein
VLSAHILKLPIPGGLNLSDLLLERLQELGPQDIREVLRESLYSLSVLRLLLKPRLQLLVLLVHHSHLAGVSLLELLETGLE